jgi:hypothetical protein
MQTDLLFLPDTCAGSPSLWRDEAEWPYGQEPPLHLSPCPSRGFSDQRDCTVEKMQSAPSSGPTPAALFWR